ncbi:Ig-like domain-containing protein [Marinicella rhabdoformis]|uniref:Ig-like domain-containing protein n=1 Tax=Marinicella rhabdoformis TaxID=2580566 RepID=UPI0012AEBC1B|nr:Ig-like domain-containing protein [Marinicella rhabdoformis]
MKFKHWLLSSAMTFGALGTVQAVDILVEDFETDGQGTRYVSSPEFNRTGSDHWGRTDGSNVSNISGAYSGFGGAQFWAAEDTDDGGGNGNADQTLEFTGIDITGLQNLSFSALFGAGNASGSGASANGGYDSNDSIMIQYKIDGGSYVNGMCFSYEAPGGGDFSNEPLTLDADCTDFADHNDGTNRLSPAMQTFGFDIPVTGAVLDILITVNMESAKEEVAFDNIVISGDVGGDNAPEVTSTLPADSAIDVAVDSTITVNFSEAVDATATAVTLMCDAQTVGFSGLPFSGSQLVITPDSDLANDAVCAVNVVAAEVTDQDGTADNMAADYGFGFTVESLVVIPPAIIINEFQADPAGDITGDANGDGTRDGSQDEFVELYNNSGSDLDVSGWTVSDATSTRHTFPANSIIPADCSLVVFGGGTPTGAFGQSVVQTASTNLLGLNNGGDTITVNDGNNDVAVLDYSAFAPSDQSGTLDPDVTGSSYVDHSAATGSAGALFSPGTKVDGTVFAGCPAPVDVAPTVSSTSPANGDMNVAVDASITVDFSEAVDVTAGGMTLTCDAQTIAFSGLPASGASIEITPTADFAFNAACTVNVVAAEVTDQDGNVDNMAADYDFTFVVVAPPQLREIYEIQGSGLTSPYLGLTVITENNIVTALDTNGFFMQTPDARDDMDVNTSNGIYVYTGNNVPVAEGDDVNVTGEVDEYYDATQIGFGSTIVVNSSGNALPTAITFDDTFPPTDPTVAVCSTDQEIAKYECMEGMLIDMPQGYISSAYAAYFGANISDLVVKAGPQRALREPGIEYPGGGGSIQTFDGNPELFEVDIDELLLSPAYYSAGSEISIEGVIGYNFGEYEVWPKSLTVINENVLPGVVRAAQAQEVTVASFNLFRLFDDVDDKGEEDDDAVATTQEFQEKVAKLSDYVVNTLKAPMVVAVQEVENLNALTVLADKINTDSGLNYQAELIEGNDKGGIDVGVLYQSNVSLAAVNQLGKDTTIVNPDMSVTLLHDRPPLHVQADVAVGFDEFRVNLLIVHLRSRGSIDDAQEGERVRLKRLAQANDVASMVADIEANHADEAVVVIGDFNAFQFSDGYVDVMGQIDGNAVESMNTLWTEPLFVAEPMTQAVQFMTPFDQYSYVYQGNAQVLDNAVLNDEALLPFVDIEFGRGNADANIDFGEDTQTVLRASDHDGLVLYFTVELDVIFRNGFED